VTLKSPNIELHCMTVTDPATGFFETVEISEKTADVIANWLEIHWLTRHPWPAEITMDEGREFARKVSETLKNECGVKRKIVTSCNPQANSMIERCHKTLHNMICSAQIKDKWDLGSFLGFKGIGGMSESHEFQSSHYCTRNACTVGVWW